MKLHVKLTLSLLAGLVVVVSVAQVLQHMNTTSRITELSQAEMQLLSEREKENAWNIYNAAESAVAGSLERGEMEKFQKLLEEQREVKGLMEFSLFDREGKVSHSSDAVNVERALPEHLRERLTASHERLYIENEDSIEIYQPQRITGDCVRCHTSWDKDGVGGVTYFRFSTEALVQATQKAEAAIAETERSALRTGVITVLSVVAILMVTMYFVVRKLLGRPLAAFVKLLKTFEKDRVDLRQRLAVQSRDEIGELGRSFNAFLEKMNIVIGQAQQIGQTVGDAAQTNAASVEETSASMNETASISKQNANSAQEANNLMNTVTEKIRVVTEAMQNLTHAMEEISTSSRETQKIIMTINDIASQTNLLALNAAVEAARAGEAGAGFAVVAESVRSLAKKSAEAAQVIGDRIENTVHKIEEGSGMVKRTDEVFADLAENNDQAAQLVQHIAHSSLEQAQGIEQVNTALSQMDSSTQMSASNAHELTDIMSKFKTDAELKTVGSEEDYPAPGHPIPVELDEFVTV